MTNQSRSLLDVLEVNALPFLGAITTLRTLVERLSGCAPDDAVTEADRQLTDLPHLINDVHGALGTLVGLPAEPPKEEQKPAVPPKKSITPDYLICLEDGKRFKSLKRHLKTHYDLSPEQYREKWGLPSDYPMVAPNYAEARSRLAKEMGLGQRRAKAS
jgi:predicted transcriptional regulator